LGCGQCGGIWLDNASAQAAVKQKDDAVMTLARRASQRASIPTETRDVIACPACKTTMGRVQRAGVTIDVCTMHGTWFDRNELGVVLGELRRPPMRPVAPLIDQPLLASEIPDFKQGAGLDGTESALVAGGILTAVLGLAALAGDR
jgi:Zn-finger nucleic acid-binding protein